MNPSGQRILKRDPQPPLGVIASLVGGFETVNRQLWLILPPLLLDLFFWLGPQLSIKPMVDTIARDLQNMALGAPPGSLISQSAQNWQQFTTVSESINLFWALSTAPLGVPSMMAWRTSEAVSTHWLGVMGVGNPLINLILLVALSTIGLFAAAIYFEGIAQAVRDGRFDLIALLRRVGLVWVYLIGFAICVLVVSAVLGVPAFAFSMLLAALNNVLGSAALALTFSLVFWVLVFGLFTPHAITLGQRGLFSALWESLALVRRNLGPTTGLVATVLLLYVGLGLVWTLAPADSWMNLIGVLAHAVVSTALVTATFVYFQDRSRWQREQTATRTVRLRA